jgi:hypothetical protein
MYKKVFNQDLLVRLADKAVRAIGREAIIILLVLALALFARVGIAVKEIVEAATEENQLLTLRFL